MSKQDEIALSGRVLRWALARSGKDPAKFPDIDFEQDSILLQSKKIEPLAKKLYVPFGYMFLSEPPAEEITIADFRRFSGGTVLINSANLVDTVHMCLRCRDWRRAFLMRNGQTSPVPFIGKAKITDDVVAVAQEIRALLEHHPVGRNVAEDILPALVKKIETFGVMATYSGVTLGNTHRPLDPNEFCGFAIVDDLAPSIFVNGKLPKTAQLFTLVHEFAHLWLGKGGVSSNADQINQTDDSIEQWCNSVAAEFLVPSDAQEIPEDANSIENAVKAIIRRYGVSQMVALLRLKKSGVLKAVQFEILWQEALTEAAKNQAMPQASSGGDYYNTAFARMGKIFPTSVILDTIQGNTLHSDAMRLLNVVTTSTFNKLSHRLNITLNPTKGG